MAVFAMAIGGFLLFIVRRNTSHIERLRRVGHTTSAVVVDYEHRHDGPGGETAYPLVQFQGPDGDLITARTDFGGSYVPNIGERVNVLFDPEKPSEAHLESRLSDSTAKLGWVFGWVWVGGWMAAIVVALLLYRS